MATHKFSEHLTKMAVSADQIERKIEEAIQTARSGNPDRAWDLIGQARRELNEYAAANGHGANLASKLEAAARAAQKAEKRK